MTDIALHYGVVLINCLLCCNILCHVGVNHTFRKKPYKSRILPDSKIEASTSVKQHCCFSNTDRNNFEEYLVSKTFPGFPSLGVENFIL